MRKLFSTFAAVLVALATNAAVINITPTSPEAADNLRLALAGAANGDTIVMAAGTYVESNGDYLAFAGKEVVVCAAKKAEVIIQPQVPIQVTAGGCAHFEGVKFDASRLAELADWYEHLIYPADAADNNRIVLDGCELYGFNMNKSMLFCSGANKLAAVTINNCYIHNTMKSVLFVENSTDAVNVQVTNSTFANIATNTESYWAGIIDLRAAESQLLVDHCTFYDVIPMNTDYSCVSKITLANGAASNCIFMLSTAQDGIRAMRGVTATNCITFNYLKDSGTGIHSSVTQNNCVQADPLFVDAANGDFTLGEGSPALTMNEGQAIGDPRWDPANKPVVLPTCADIYNMAKDSATALNEVVVTYVNGKNVWVKDETGAMLIYLSAEATWEAGDVLSGIEGVVDIYNGLYELKPSADQAAAVVATPGEAPEPEVLTEIVVADMNKYVLLEEVTLDGSYTEGTQSNINLTLGENTYVIRNKFNNGYTFKSNKIYDVLAVVSYYKTDLQLFFIDAEMVGGDPDTIALDFSEGSGWVSNEDYKEWGATDVVLYNIPVVDQQLSGDGDYLALDFYPEDPNDISGTYSFEDETLDADYTYLIRVNGTDTAEIAFVDGEVAFEVLAASEEQMAAQIAIAALLIGDDDNIYTVSGTFVLYYDFLIEEGIEDVALDPKKSIKAIRMGQLVIECNGKTFNAAGAVLK